MKTETKELTQNAMAGEVIDFAIGPGALTPGSAGLLTQLPGRCATVSALAETGFTDRAY